MDQPKTIIQASSIIEATTEDGTRRRFVVAEHANIGDGWLFRSVDGNPVVIVPQNKLADIKIVGWASFPNGGRLVQVFDRKMSNKEIEDLTK